MFYQDINLDTLFDSGHIDSALEFYGMLKKNDYPELDNLLGWYQKKLKKILKYSFPFSYGETYTQSVNIDEQNNYQMAWNIASAKNVIKRYKVPVRDFFIRDLAAVVDQQCINRSHLDFAVNNNNPIIVALYPPLKTDPKLFVIDGNHRVIAKLEAGQEQIPAYVLPPEQHLKAVIGEGYRLLYKIHFNYYLAACYMGGIIEREELEQYLYPI